jgi:glyoxylase-like metal-dependent hydrolase (beta-lactamase superfamily II)
MAVSERLQSMFFVLTSAIAAATVPGCGDRSGIDGKKPENVAIAVADAPVLEPRAMTIVPGIHMLGGLSPSAAYVVETSEGLVLIDSGLRADAGPVRADLSTLKLEESRVRAVLLTHAHGDHTGGAGYFREKTGARIYAGRADAAILEAGGPREAFFSTFHVPSENPHRTTIDVKIDGGESIEFGDARFHAIATPGHTPGSVCWLLEYKSIIALFSGDVIMGLVGDLNSRGEIAKPLGTYSAYLAPRYRGDATAFLTSLRALRKLDRVDLILPGHPRMDSIPTSPAISRKRRLEMIDRGIADMRSLISRYQTDGANHLDGIPKKLADDLYYFGDRDRFAIYGLILADRFYLVNAPGGPGIVDFLREGFRKLKIEPLVPTDVILTDIGPDETSGLKDLLTQTQVRIFTSAEGVAPIKNRSPEGTIVIAANDSSISDSLGLSIEPIALRVPGRAPLVWRIRLKKKSALVTGSLPVDVDQALEADFVRRFSENEAAIDDSLDALDQLRGLKPDLWIPTVAVDGQNACLYDNSWAEILDRDRSLIERARSVNRLLKQAKTHSLH